MAVYLRLGLRGTNLGRKASRYHFRRSVSTTSQLWEGAQEGRKVAENTKNAELPDYNTDVNIHLHKLKRPDRPPPKFKWKEMDNLAESTKGSLVPDTLKEMEESEEFKITAENLKKFGQKKLTRDERKKRQRALDNMGIPGFLNVWKQKREENKIPTTETQLHKKPVSLMQLNIGIYCNQACNHCHVESSPKRKEMMNRDTAERCLHIVENSPTIETVDITGGAPELCSEFRFLAKGARDLGKHVIDRCNLTALLEPGQEDTGQFLAENKIHVIASLPCYTSKNVNLQRGKGVFAKSIQGLVILNELGYGKPGTGLELDLVYNPLGGFLPPPQKELQDKYSEELWEHFGIEFNQLFTMTNMPIKRFVDFLYRRNELDDYMALLVRNYNLKTAERLMCLDQLSVGWDGRIYDCDFNQQLELEMHLDKDPAKALSVFDISSASELEGSIIKNDNHCFGCTAGMGSS